MKVNNTIPFFDVTTITKDMCELITGDEYKAVYVPVVLNNDGKEEKYISVVMCKEDEEELVKEEINKKNNTTKDEYELNKKFCHIATYKENEKKDFISFDKDDNCLVKASFNENYNYLEYFFKSFIRFRNNLIENNQVVKDDDIYQYFLSVTGFENNKKRNKAKNK